MIFCSSVVCVLLMASCVNACGRNTRTGGYGLRRNGDNGVTGYVYRHDEGSNVRYSGYGSADLNGNLGVGVGFETTFRKREVQLPRERFHLRIETSPCNFVIYDGDKNGVITYDEIHNVFTDVDLAKKLFRDLDSTSGDEVITYEEFKVMAPKIIYECGAKVSETAAKETPNNIVADVTEKIDS